MIRRQRLPDGDSHRNFLIVCIDCLRYDSFHRSLRKAASFAHLVKSRGVSFHAAFSTAPWTYPATNSILTGRYPHGHGARQLAAFKRSVNEPWPAKLDSSLPTVFTSLNAASYFTFGISTIFWALHEGCDYPGCQVQARSEKQDLTYRNVKAEWVVEALADTLGRCPERAAFLGYIHLSDLHRPYDLEVAGRQLTEPVSLLDGVEGWDMRPYLRDSRLTDTFRRTKQRLYEALVDYVFAQMTEIVELLKRSRCLEHTTLIITADHGEEFWDHAEFQKRWYDCGYRSEKEWLIGTGHGHTLFDELVHVPLVVINPGFDVSQEELSYPVSLVDVYPTILELAGLPNSPELDGRSLSRPSPERQILVESTLYGYERKALVDRRYKHICSPHEHELIAYDRRLDATEQRPWRGAADEGARQRLDHLFAVDAQLDDGAGRGVC